MKQSTNTISTPLRYRLQRARSKYLPVAFFLLACAGCVFLLQFQNQTLVQVGEVEAVDYTLTTPLPGVVQWATADGDKIPVFTKVKKGQVIAGLDDEPVRKQIYDVKQQVLALGEFATSRLANSLDPRFREQAKALVGTSGPRADVDAAEDSESRNAQIEAWQALSGFAELSMKKIRQCEQKLELRKMDARLRTLQPAVTGSQEASTPAAEEQQLQTQRMLITGELQKLAAGILSEEELTLGEMSDVDIDNLPAAEQIIFRQRSNRCRLISEQLTSIASMAELLDIVSPAKGQISKAFVRSAQSLQQGIPVATVTPATGTWVVVYAREQGIQRVDEGVAVTVSLLHDPRQKFSSTVASVGPKIESIPTRQRSNPRVEQWGRPMRIAVPPNVEIPPGSLVSVRFELSASGVADDSLKLGTDRSSAR